MSMDGWLAAVAWKTPGYTIGRRQACGCPCGRYFNPSHLLKRCCRPWSRSYSLTAVEKQQVWGGELTSKFPRSLSSWASLGSAGPMGPICAGPTHRLETLKGVLLTSGGQKPQRTFRGLGESMPPQVGAERGQHDTGELGLSADLCKQQILV